MKGLIRMTENFDWTCWIWLVMINGGHILFLVNSWVITVNLWKYSQKVKGFSTNINPHRKCVVSYYIAAQNLNPPQLVILQSAFSSSFWHHCLFPPPKHDHIKSLWQPQLQLYKNIKICIHYWLVWIFTLKKKKVITMFVDLITSLAYQLKIGGTKMRTCQEILKVVFGASTVIQASVLSD